jgi:hypothetical protein
LKLPIQNPGWAAVLSFLVPGLGQAMGGKPARGAVVALPAVALFFVFVPAYLLANRSLIGTSAGLTSLLILDVVACVYHVWAVVDAYREIKPPSVQRGMRGLPDRRATIPLELATLAGLVVATFGVHAYFGAADLNSCTMQGRPCPRTDAPAVAIASQGAGTSPGPAEDGSGSIPTAPASGVPSPAPSGSAPMGWHATADRLRVHSGPGTEYPTIQVLRQSQRITGQVVVGGSYTVGGESRSDWIKIDPGQPGAGGYVAAAYYVHTALLEPSADASLSPAPTAPTAPTAPAGSPSDSPSPAT